MLNVVCSRCPIWPSHGADTSVNTSHLGTGWQDQHARVGRWRRRLAAIRSGIPPDKSQAEALDDVYAFFMNCYHLRDWIIASALKTKDEVDAFVRTDPDLALCRDICTGMKHFRIDTDKALSSPNWSTASMFTFSFPAGVAEIRPIPGEHEQWVFTTEGTSVDMFDLADRCVAAWDRFLAGP